jgi:hypothetical protein
MLLEMLLGMAGGQAMFLDAAGTAGARFIISLTIASPSLLRAWTLECTDGRLDHLQRITLQHDTSQIHLLNKLHCCMPKPLRTSAIDVLYVISFSMFIKNLKKKSKNLH